jgi:hypothetical protein
VTSNSCMCAACTAPWPSTSSDLTGARGSRGRTPPAANGRCL